MSSFTNTADSRETSIEIMAAIELLARASNEAVRIWEEPTEKEIIAIWERVTKNGLNDSKDFCWGASGDNWASSIES